MKNVIYQYWDGDVRPSAQYGSDCMREYSERIGADYIFETNANFGKRYNLGRMSPYYGCFKPVFDDKFLEYDNVLFADTDVFPVSNLETNIFDSFTGELGMADEPLQPKYRSMNLGMHTSQTENTWANAVTNAYGARLPTDEKGRYKVYNSGVVLYSNQGLRKCREQFAPFKEYTDLMSKVGLFGKVYSTDQGYLHAMAFSMDIDFQQLDNEWNRYITYDPTAKPIFGRRKVVDPRTPDTKMVHVQMRGADNMNNDWHYRVVNEPLERWGTNNKGEILV